MRENYFVKLKYLCTSFSTPIMQQELQEEGLYNVYGASGLVGYKDTYAVNKPYLGIVKDGAGVGRINYYESYSSLLGTLSYIVPNSGVDIIWLKYVIMSLDLGKDVGKTTIPHIYFSDYGNCQVLYVSLSQQQRIADFLDRKCAEIDAVIVKTKATIEEYKKLKQSIITEAVTKGIRGDRPMKDSGIEWIGEIPADWSISKIKIGVSKVGSGKTPLGGAESYAEEGILFLRSQNVYDTGLLLDSPTYITEAVDEEMKSTRVYPRDVLLNITGGSIGRCCIFPNECVRANVNQHVSIIRVIESVFLPEYMHYYWLSSLGHTAIDLYQTGGNREGMSADAIKNSPIPIIPIEEQNEIVAYLDNKCAEMDTLIVRKTALLDEMEAYKKSVIYEYVTGKKECETIKEAETVATIYPYFPAVLSTDKARFAQAILMSRILDKCRTKMGRVKLEKMLYTIENSIGFDFETEYVREAAGPLDSSIYECERIISRRNKWYILNSSKYGVSYTPTKESSKYKKYYDKYFREYNTEIDRIINIFMNYDADQAEIIATLFAAWNDAIIEKKQVSDEEIVDDVLSNWNESKKRFSKDIWLRAIKNMRQNNLVPKGYGKHTIIKEVEV